MVQRTNDKTEQDSDKTPEQLRAQLREAFAALFINEGANEEKAQKMAEIVAQGW